MEPQAILRKELAGRIQSISLPSSHGRSLILVCVTAFDCSLLLIDVLGDTGSK